jgi:hypothetical protein
MRLPLVAPQGWVAVVLDYAQIVVGSLLVAGGTNPLFVPNAVVSGGFRGNHPGTGGAGRGFRTARG